MRRPRPIAWHNGFHVLNFDGGSRGNPGPSAYGFVVRDPHGRIVADGYDTLDEIATNNVAEYTGLLEGLRKCAEMHIHRVEVRGDSKLVIEQMKGKFRVKSWSLRPLHLRCKEIAASMDDVLYTHVPRELNVEADIRVNRAFLAKFPSVVHDITIPVGSVASVPGGGRRASLIEREENDDDVDDHDARQRTRIAHRDDDE